MKDVVDKFFKRHKIKMESDKITEYSNFIDNVDNLLLLGFGGSHSYGTNIEGSDVDIRGIYVNPMKEFIGTYDDQGQKQHEDLDITVYSIKKIFKLLGNCNPNTIEILGLREDDYLYKSEMAKLLLDNKHMFLSKRAINSFGGYALSQLNRLMNRSGRGNDEILSNEKRSLEKAIMDFKGRYKPYIDYIDVVKEDEEEVLKLNMKYDKIPINMLSNVLSEMNSIHKDYAKSTRNDKAIAHNKLSKHMMHLLRLYMMGVDILLKEEIITYREDEHDLLMGVRNGDYLDGNTPTKDFEYLLTGYKKKFEIATQLTTLPKEPDWEKLSELQEDIILSHMFPVGLRVPKYKESWLVDFVDDVSAIYERLGSVKTELTAAATFLIIALMNYLK